jgi:hypothetical protein
MGTKRGPDVVGLEYFGPSCFVGHRVLIFITWVNEELFSVCSASRYLQGSILSCFRYYFVMLAV